MAFWTSDRLGTLQKTCFRRGKRLENTIFFRLRRAIVQSLRNMTISVCVERLKMSFLARRRRNNFGVLFPHKKAPPYKKAPPLIRGVILIRGGFLKWNTPDRRFVSLFIGGSLSTIFVG